MDVLANWAWQGCAVALAATAILRASRRMSATTRYHLWWVTLLVVLLLPVVPWLLTIRETSVGLETAVETTARTTDAARATTLGVVLPIIPLWSLSLLALGWFAWATISLSRTLAALVSLRHAKRSARPFPAAREVRLETWLSLRAQGRPAALGVSDSVRAAAVLGLTSPSIVVAPSVLGALDDPELDQIVVHEWAHVQRRDDLARLVQRIIVALAGLHPAIWWIDRQLNLEREIACDDWAVNATGSARSLAVCLTKLAALPGRPADGVLLPAALLSSQLTTRVVRLLDRNRNTSTTRTIGVPMLIAPVLGALALVVASVELVVTSPGTPDQSRAPISATPAVVTVDGSAGTNSAAAFPEPGSGTRDAARSSSEGARRSAGVQKRTAGLATAGNDRSAAYRAPERAGATSTARQHPQRQEIVLPMERPLVEEHLGVDLPGITMPTATVVTPAATVGSGVTPGSQPVASPTLWGAAADAGVTVGKGSQKAAVATAGFFTRLSKSISGVF